MGGSKEETLEQGDSSSRIIRTPSVVVLLLLLLLLGLLLSRYGGSCDVGVGMLIVMLAVPVPLTPKAAGSAVRGGRLSVPLPSEALWCELCFSMPLGGFEPSPLETFAPEGAPGLLAELCCEVSPLRGVIRSMPPCAMLQSSPPVRFSSL